MDKQTETEAKSKQFRQKHLCSNDFSFFLNLYSLVFFLCIILDLNINFLSLSIYFSLKHSEE